ncbi:MAG TPA: hypothetical protein VIV11_21795 [Kofleriaceae bacterium]
MRKLATILFVLAATTAAHAKPKKGNAKVHMDKAAKAHKAGKFDVALTELQAAYAIDPQPKLLFAIGQVYAKLDNCAEAIEHYEKFNDKTKDKSKQAVAKQAIDACKKKLDDAKPDKADSKVFRAKKPPEDELPTADSKPAGEPKPEPKLEATPEPQPVETKPEPKVEPAPEPKPTEIRAFDEPPPRAKPAPEPVATVTVQTQERKPWYRDAIGDTLVITGVGATLASFIVYRSAKNELDDAEKAGSLADYDEHRNNAERKQLYTWMLAGGGIAFVTAGVIRYTLRSDGGESRGLAVVPNQHGGLITWSGGF